MEAISFVPSLEPSGVSRPIEPFDGNRRDGIFIDPGSGIALRGQALEKAMPGAEVGSPARLRVLFYFRKTINWGIEDYSGLSVPFLHQTGFLGQVVPRLESPLYMQNLLLENC